MNYCNQNKNNSPRTRTWGSSQFYPHGQEVLHVSTPGLSSNSQVFDVVLRSASTSSLIKFMASNNDREFKITRTQSKHRSLLPISFMDFGSWSVFRCCGLGMLTMGTFDSNPTIKQVKKGAGAILTQACIGLVRMISLPGSSPSWPLISMP